MTKRFTFAVLATAAALAAVACLDFEQKSSLTGPSGVSDLKALLGTWSSTSVLPSAESCSDFKWAITEQNGSTASGTFSATCPGGLKVAGTATGTMFGSTVTFTANATATVPGLPACAITLNGTAYLETSRIRIPYTGQTCLGSVKGEEILNRN